MPVFSRHPFQAVFCLFDRHDPDRETVHWDGTHYAGTCRSCRRDIRRHAHRVWKKVSGQK